MLPLIMVPDNIYIYYHTKGPVVVKDECPVPSEELEAI